MDGNRYFHTFKSKDRANREESEEEISAFEFERLWPLTTTTVEKVRYQIPHGDVTIELDIYYGNLQGLVTAEVEFTNERRARNFVPPIWFGKEVTYEEKYKNRILAEKGYPE